MNTNTLKKFAQATRQKLLTQVNARLEQVLTMDSAELREQAAAVSKLQKAINDTSKAQVVEKVAYTWFNRLMALRFMDANDYQPIGIRVVTPKDGYTLPELLDEAKSGQIPDELSVPPQRIYDLLDGNIPSSNPENEAYKLLLIGACNHLHKVFPFLFERINSYAELLLPNDLTSEFSVVQDMRDGMTAEDCQEVEIIGWLYQFYISERKDEVFAAKGKVAKADIPAATQLFTPRWIVEYMVQNTLGKLWLQNRPDSNLRQHMPYFIESPSVASDDFLEIKEVKDITLLDQACGSGHILVYAFDLFTKIYEEEGYNPSEIPKLIIEKNLYGFEIDERAAQLAGLALMMKARSYHRRVFRKEVKPNIMQYADLGLKMYEQDDFYEVVTLKIDSPLVKKYLDYGHCLGEDIIERWQETFTDEDTGETATIDRAEKRFFKGNTLLLKDIDTIKELGIDTITFYDDDVRNTFRELAIPLPRKLYQDLILMKQATNYGSLIQPKASLSDLADTLKLLYAKKDIPDNFLRQQIEELTQAIWQLIQLGRKYHCIVDNPPYMGGGNMNKPLSTFVKQNYKDSKADLMACFMEAGLKMLYSKGFLGMINQHSWMFLSSYEKLRKKLIKDVLFDTLLHLGPRTFPEIGGEVVQNAAFVFWNIKPKGKGMYIRLVDFKDSELKKEKTLSLISSQLPNYFYEFNQKEFDKIPGYSIGYWLSKNSISSFESGTPLLKLSKPRQGLATMINPRFVKSWFEVTRCNTNIPYIEESKSEKKWVEYNKGGDYRKWFGNRNHIVNWKNNGEEIKALSLARYNSISKRVVNEASYFKESITWSKIGGGFPSFRNQPSGAIFDVAGMSIFFKNTEEKIYLIGFLNSVISKLFLNLLSPTLNFEGGQIAQLPIIGLDTKLNLVQNIVEDLIENSKTEWNSRETAWDFEKNGLLNHHQQTLKTTYQAYCQHWHNQFHQLHQNEEELNRQFIQIYGLEDELTPDVPLEDVTILKQETSIENGELVFDAGEVMRQFVSYAVGCMFGRYSLDKEGLILANQGETLEDHLKKVGKSIADLSFLPDDDNIIPVLDDEWFEDDIVGRFYEFLKVTFGKEKFDENLAFVEDSLGKSIRKYFGKDFYTDHIKRYKKRPIYWLFSSPKGSFSVLIYLHRYTPDTLNQILNGYLVEYREKLRAYIERQEHIRDTGSAAEQNKAAKAIKKYQVILLELKEYERDTLYPLATERIQLDLDDGVLVNYNKFGKAIKEVKGLNDKKTKEKVRKFDWIEVGEIR